MRLPSWSTGFDNSRCIPPGCPKDKSIRGFVWPRTGQALFDLVKRCVLDSTPMSAFLRGHMRTTPILLLLLLLGLLAPQAGLVAQEKDPRQLVRDLGDPVRSQAAARELESLGSKVLPMLGESLASSATSEAVKKGILQVLGKMGPKGRRLLADALEDPALELAALEELAGLKPDRNIEELMLARLQKSGNPRVRLVAMNWLADNASASKADPLLFAALGDEDEEVRDRASLLVSQRLGVAAVPTLMGMLRDAEFARSVKNRPVRTALIKTLGLVGKLGPDAAARVVPTLVQALGVEDEKPYAVAALVGIGGASVPALLMILKAGDTTRASAAMEALLSIGEEAAPEVVELLQARHPKMRRLATQFLAFYQDPKVFPLLKALYARSDSTEKVSILRIAALYPLREAFELIASATNDPDMAVRMAAVQILGNSSVKGALPVLLGRVEEDPDLDVRLAAIRSIHRQGDPSVVPSLARLLFHDKWQIRLAILKILANLGGPEQVQAIAQQLSHRRSEVASAASRTLSNITYLTGERSVEGWASEVANALKAARTDKEVDVESRSVETPEGSLDFLVAGEKDRTILALVPNDQVVAALLPRYVALLAQRYRVVVMPFPGCARTGTTKPTLKECAAMTAEKIQLVKEAVTTEPVTLLLQSVTAYGGLQFTVDHPASVDRIIWANPVFPRPALIRSLAQVTMARLPARWKQEADYLSNHPGDFLAKARASYLSRIELASQIKQEGRAMLVAPGHYGLSRLLQEVSLSDDASVEGLVAALERPALLVFGQDDWVLDAHQDAFKVIGKIRRNLIVTTVPGSIRYTPVEKPEAFFAACRKFMENYRFKFSASSRDGRVSQGQIVVADSLVLAREDSQADVEVAPLPAAGSQLGESSRLTRFMTGTGADTTPGEGSSRTVAEPQPSVEALAEQPSSEAVAVATKDPETPTAPELTPDSVSPETELVAADTPEELQVVATSDENPDGSAKDVATPEVAKVQEAQEVAPQTELAQQEPEVEQLPEETVPGLQTVDLTNPPQETPALDVSETGSGSSQPLGTPGLQVGAESDRSLNWLGWTLLGSGLAIAGAGAYLTVAALGKAEDADGLDPMIPGYSDRFDTTFADARNYAIGSYVAYGVGAAAVLFGLDILLGWPIPMGKRSQSTWMLTPIPTAGGSSLVLEFRLR